MEIKRNKVPIEIFSPLRLLKPPYQTRRPIQIDVEISAIGKKIELIHTVLNHAFLCLILMLLKLSISTFSRLKICTILTPLILS
tara:strand:+ start:1439 stop:1690 length:252 start_codon:yes stop_codon:yes gene_type:complete